MTSPWIDVKEHIDSIGIGNPFFVRSVDCKNVTDKLSTIGFDVAVIQRNSANTERDFFVEISRMMRFPSYFGNNWDAFADCFDESIYSRDRSMAIVWENASDVARTNPRFFVKAVHELLVSTASAGQRTSGDKLQIEVFLSGEWD